MSSLPLEFDNQLVGLDQLTGYNYVAGFPELMSLVSEHCRKALFGYTKGYYIYPHPGKQTVYASKGKSWKPGQRLRAYRFGATSQWRTVVVQDYTPATGRLRIETVACNYPDPLGYGGGYYLTPNFAEYPTGAPVAIASGGAASIDVDSFRKAFQLPSNSNYAEFFSDFLTQDWISYFDDNGSVYQPVRIFAGAAPWSKFERAGVTRVSRTSAGYQEIGLGVNGWTDFSGADTRLKMAFRVPILPTFGNPFTLVFGLIGPLAKIAITLSEASLYFASSHGASPSFTATSLTTVGAVVANTWYTLEIKKTGANLILVINGTSINLGSYTNLMGPLATKGMRPQLKLTTTTAITRTIYLDYIYFLKHMEPAR